MYAKVEHSTQSILKIRARPDWKEDDLTPVSDEVLRAGGYQTTLDEAGNSIVLLDSEGNKVLSTDSPFGWMPVEDEPLGAFDPLLSTVAWDDVASWQVEDTRVVRTRTIAHKPLIDIKSAAAGGIDNAASGTRSAFLTSGTGQALEYDETRAEASRWQADAAPDVANYPMIRAEWNARKVEDPAITVETVVQEIVAEYELWRVVGSAIKEVRRTAKVAIEIAETRERVREIVDWANAAYQQITQDGTFDPLP